jgi:hypothetical protein
MDGCMDKLLLYIYISRDIDSLKENIDLEIVKKQLSLLQVGVRLIIRFFACNLNGLTSPCSHSSLLSTSLHIPAKSRTDATNHLVQSPPPPRDPPPARVYPNHRADLGAAGGAPSNGPRRRGGPRKAEQLRCDATRCRHPPPPQPPPRHPSSAAAAAASGCSSLGPARSSSFPCS